AYINRARFGVGQRVGLGSAARTFFGRPTSQLTRGEWVMLLSWLPRPARSTEVFRDERVRVYRARAQYLRDHNLIDDSTWAALQEIPEPATRFDGRTFEGLFTERAAMELRTLARSRGFDSTSVRVET